MNFTLKKISSLGCALLFSSTLVFAQSSFAKDKPVEKPGMMGQGMMGQGMMGHGMGMCPLSSMEDVKMTVTETSDGVTISYSAKDKKDVSRLQKIAKISQLTQELKEEEQKEKK